MDDLDPYTHSRLEKVVLKLRLLMRENLSYFSKVVVIWCTNLLEILALLSKSLAPFLFIFLSKKTVLLGIIDGFCSTIIDKLKLKQQKLLAI